MQNGMIAAKVKRCSKKQLNKSPLALFDAVPPWLFPMIQNDLLVFDFDNDGNVIVEIKSTSGQWWRAFAGDWIGVVVIDGSFAGVHVWDETGFSDWCKKHNIARPQMRRSEMH